MGTSRHVTPLKLVFLQSEVTQREVAEAVGLSEGQFSRIVNGLHAPDSTKQAIANFLGRKVDELWPDTPIAERAA